MKEKNEFENINKLIEKYLDVFVLCLYRKVLDEIVGELIDDLSNDL